jgi:hypothetical protein
MSSANSHNQALVGLEQRVDELVVELASLRKAIAAMSVRSQVQHRTELDQQAVQPPRPETRPSSRAAQIRRLYLSGRRPAEIAADLGVTVGNANTIVSELRGRGELPPVGSAEDAAIKARQKARRDPAPGNGVGQGTATARPTKSTAPRRVPAKTDDELVAEALAAGTVRVTKCPPAYVAPVQGAAPVGPLPHYEPEPLALGRPPRRRCGCGNLFMAWQASHRKCEACRETSSEGRRRCH